MKSVVLSVVLAAVLVLPAMATEPDITGTWTGVAEVNSGLGPQSLDVSLIVSSQDGASFSGSIEIETADESFGSPTFYGLIKSVDSLWVFKATGNPSSGLGAIYDGRYVPAVPSVSPEQIVLDVREIGNYLGNESMLFSVPYVLHVTLAKN